MGDRPEDFEGTISIEWPALIHSPGSPLHGWKVTPRLPGGEAITTVTRFTVHVGAADLVWAELTMFADADGRPVYGGGATELHIVDGQPAQATFAFLVTGMTTEAPPLVTVALAEPVMTASQVREFREAMAGLGAEMPYRVRVRPPALPAELAWMSALDADDADLLRHEVLGAVARGDLAGAQSALSDWRVTAEALSDPARREVLTGAHDPADFTEVQRPGGDGA